jgi:hypothetical protein
MKCKNLSKEGEEMRRRGGSPLSIPGFAEGNDYFSRQYQARAQRTHDEMQMAGLEDAACSDGIALGVYSLIIISIHVATRLLTEH